MEVMDCLLDPCSSELGSLGEEGGGDTVEVMDCLLDPCSSELGSLEGGGGRGHSGGHGLSAGSLF